MKRAGSVRAGMLALLLLGGSTTVAIAQTPAATTPAPGAAKLAGDWSGPYSTDGPSGTMALTVAKAGAAWKVVVDLGAEAPPRAGDPTEIKADGNVLTWRQLFGDYDVAFKATLSADGAQITGTLEANQGGSYVGGGSFTLARKT